MGKSNYQNLKRELAPSIQKDIKNLIAKKGLSAVYEGGSCGVSHNDDDSLYINLEVTTDKGAVKVYISFRYNLEKLFDLKHFNYLDDRAGIDTYKYFNRNGHNRLDLARLRIMRAVYEVISSLSKDKLAIEDIENVRSIDVDIDEKNDFPTYTVLPKF